MEVRALCGTPVPFYRPLHRELPPMPASSRKLLLVKILKNVAYIHTRTYSGVYGVPHFFGFLEKKKAVLLYFGMVKDNAAGLTKGEATRQGEAPRLASQS